MQRIISYLIVILLISAIMPVVTFASEEDTDIDESYHSDSFIKDKGSLFHATAIGLDSPPYKEIVGTKSSGMLEII